MTVDKKTLGIILIVFGVARFLFTIFSLVLGRTLISQVWNFAMCIIFVGAGIYFYRKY